MSTSIARIQAVLALSAAENASGKVASGKDSIERAEQKRHALETVIARREAEVERLAKEIEEESDPGFFEMVWDFLTGSGDRDMAELAEKSSKAGAEMKKAQQEIALLETKNAMTLQELQSAQSEVGARNADVQKNYDEDMKAAQMASR